MSMGIRWTLSMAKKLLLLDADIVIDFHKNNFWKSVVSQYDVYVGSVVAEEVKYYIDKDGNKVTIDLQTYIDQKAVTKISGSLQTISEILTKLKKKGLDGIDAGELECVAIIADDDVPNLMLCVRDHAAIKVISYLELDDKVFSAESVLIKCGFSKKRVSFENSEKRFKSFVRDAKFLLIE